MFQKRRWKRKAGPRKAAETGLPVCENCEKIEPLCGCAEIVSRENSVHVLILQHPQEPDKILGSAKLLNLGLKNSTLATGLSWPNLSKALKREADPKKWVVLYLGSFRSLAKPVSAENGASLFWLDRAGKPLPVQTREFKDRLSQVEGIIVLDGTWSQAKTLWWRNAWLLKCMRAALVTKKASLYGKFRREPRRECLSTIESAAFLIEALDQENGKAHAEALMVDFEKMVNRYSAWQKTKDKPQCD